MWEWSFTAFGIIYGLGTILIQTPKTLLTFTAFFMSVFFTVMSLMITNAVKSMKRDLVRSADKALDTAKVAQHILETSEPEKDLEAAYRHLVNTTQARLKQITNQCVDLKREELEELSTRQLKRVSKLPGGLYWATHVVNSLERLEMWSSPDNYDWMERYVHPQKDLVSSGGEIVRIFVFTEEFLKTHLEQARQLLARHEGLFHSPGAATQGKTITLATMAAGHDAKDVTILNRREVFFWHVSSDERAPIRGGQYATAPSVVREGKELFEHFRETALTPVEFIARRRNHTKVASP